MLGAPFQSLYQVDQPIGKKTVGEKRIVGAFNEELGAIIKYIVDGFGVIRIFVETLAHIGFHHVVKYLEYIAYNQAWIGHKVI